MATHFITGGAGFLGSALCNNLSEQGHTVVAFDNFSRKTHMENLNGSVIRCSGDVRNVNDLAWYINKYENKYKIDTLWHLAYINGTSSFYSDPDLVLEVGVKGAINTLDEAISHGVKNYNLVSSSEVYNEPTEVPTQETERILIPDVYNPRFSYSSGKIISELLAVHYGRKNGLNIKIFRPHNVHGQNMGLEHVIPEIVRKIVKKESGLTKNNKLIINIQGTGQETRSFCYIDDAVDEMILVDADKSTNDFPTYNIGVEDEITIEKLTHLIAAILQVEVEIAPTQKTVGSSNRRCPSMTKLKSLGYIQQHNLISGLEKTVKWYKEYYERQ